MNKDLDSINVRDENTGLLCDGYLTDTESEFEWSTDADDDDDDAEDEKFNWREFCKENYDCQLKTIYLKDIAVNLIEKEKEELLTFDFFASVSLLLEVRTT